MVSDIWQRTTQMMQMESHCCPFTGYAFQLAERDLLYVYHSSDRLVLQNILWVLPISGLFMSGVFLMNLQMHEL